MCIPQGKSLLANTLVSVQRRGEKEREGQRRKKTEREKY
jgi:hypothetical protein